MAYRPDPPRSPLRVIARPAPAKPSPRAPPVQSRVEALRKTFDIKPNSAALRNGYKHPLD